MFPLPTDLHLPLPFTLDPSLLLIPLITGIIGYITNWVGIRFLFHPVDFVGVRVPGLEEIAPLFPRRIQQIPGIMRGRLGWQGIIPSRAEKMASIAADKGITKLASEDELYEEFDPDKIAEHVLASADDEIHEIVEEILREEHPELWANTPRAVKRLVHARVRQQLPEIVDEVTEDIGENIHQLLDVKMMVVHHLDANPELVNRLFLEVGDEELEFIVNSGFFLGGFLGIFSIPLYVYIDAWWVLPVAGVVVGYLTNFIALKIIFLPYHPHEIGPFNIQGLFVKRQPEVSTVYAEVNAEDVVTLENIAQNLLHGNQSDRTRQMIRSSLRPVVDRVVWPATPVVRAMTGDGGYEQLRESIAEEGVEFSVKPLQDREFNEERSRAIKDLFERRMQELPPDEYAQMLRLAFKEDEWLLIFIGAVLGFVAGWIQLLVVRAI